jgi:hypothetical protein
MRSEYIWIYAERYAKRIVKTDFGGLKMRIAVIGSPGVSAPDLEGLLPRGTTEIVTGGGGMERQVSSFAEKHNIKVKECRPAFEKYGYNAAFRQIAEMAAGADMVYIFWNRINRGTKFIIDRCNESGIKIKVFA